MTKGKRICKELRAIRRDIAIENGIALDQPECTHTGDCRGTCPRCEAELRFLEKALSHRLSLGRAATVAGLSLSLAACGGVSTNGSLPTENNAIEQQYDDMEGYADSEPVDPSTPLPAERNPKMDISTSYTSPDEIYTGDLIIEGDIDPIQDGISIEKTADNDKEEIFVLVDDDPEFPGGEEAYYKYIEDNLVYPEIAIKEGISGTVVIKGVIEKDGSITKTAILREIGGGCGKEGLRLIQNMPKWTPGKKDGKTVRTEFTFPIQFQR